MSTLSAILPADAKEYRKTLHKEALFLGVNKWTYILFTMINMLTWSDGEFLFFPTLDYLYTIMVENLAKKIGFLLTHRRWNVLQSPSKRDS